MVHAKFESGHAILLIYILYLISQFVKDTAVNQDIENLHTLIWSKLDDNCFYYYFYPKMLSEMISAKSEYKTPLNCRHLKCVDILKLSDQVQSCH